MTHAPVITKHSVLDVQVCVPVDWKDDKIIEFVQQECGNTEWHVRKEGSRLLGGDPERARCHDREGFVHLMIDFL